MVDITKLPKNGIEMCEDKCPCGGQLRLHTYVFGMKKLAPEPKFYVDCARHCGRVSEWHSSPDKAIEAFDHEYPMPKRR